MKKKKNQKKRKKGKYCYDCAARYCSEKCYHSDSGRHSFDECEARASLTENYWGQTMEKNVEKTSKNTNKLLETVASDHLKNSCLCDSKGLFNLAFCIENGAGCMRDQSKSHAIYEFLAKNGELKAMLKVAANYRYGVGVEEDEKKHNA